MKEYQEKINKICRIISVLTDINTVFLDKNKQITVEYNTHAVPDLLKKYLNVNYEIFAAGSGATNLDNSEIDAHFYSNIYLHHYISSTVYENGEFCGIVIIGPYLIDEPDSVMIQDIIMKMNLSISLRPILKQYYKSISILNKHKATEIADCLSCLVKGLPLISSGSPKIQNEEFMKTYPSNVMISNIKQNTELYADMIKQRYDKENEIIHAVESGNYPLIEKIFSEYGFLFKILERVPNDPLRSYKNLCFVFNTLLRKAAENGGVHPIYIDSVSEKFATNIEKTTTLKQITNLNQSMLFEYCELVNKLSLRQYSQFTQQLIEYIRLNLDKNLSLDTLSKVMNSSSTKISKNFKIEVGESIIDYINDLRINEAIRLMANEKYNITEIAFKVGYNDVNYFTKVFRKYKGTTPSEFRKNHHNS